MTCSKQYPNNVETITREDKGLQILARIIAFDIVTVFNEEKALEEKIREVMKDERLVAALQ